MKTGFYVWNPAGNFPRIVHKSGSNAVTEATRLAHSNPGEEFLVLQIMGKAVVERPSAFVLADEVDSNFYIPF